MQAEERPRDEIELVEEHDNLLNRAPVIETLNGELQMGSTSKAEPKGRWDQLGLGLITLGLVLLVLPTWFLILSGDFSAMGWYAFHPPLQSLSILFLILGIIPIQPPTPSASSRESRFTTHQILVLRLTLPLVVLGSTAIWYNKARRSAAHFVTWHGLLGLVSVGCILVQAAMGVGMAWYGKSLFGSEVAARKMYKYHRISGYILVGLVLVTAHLAGGYSHWAKKEASPALRAVAYWLGPLLTAVGLGVRVETSKMHLGSTRR